MGSQTQMVMDTILAKIDAGVLDPGDVIAEDALIADPAKADFDKAYQVPGVAPSQISVKAARSATEASAAASGPR